MIKTKLLAKLKHDLKSVGTSDDIELTHPSQNAHGDFTINLALRLAKERKQNPLELAREIAKLIKPDNIVERAEIAPPGFINIWIHKKLLLDELESAAKNLFSFPIVTEGKAAKVAVEFAHPNTHKLFHIGHLRNIITGEALVRILESVGNTVVRTNYQGDVGMHIAKCLWSLRKELGGNKNYFGDLALESKIKLLGEAYAKGSKAYEEDEDAKQEIIEINKLIYQRSADITPLWQETRSWSLEYFDSIYKRLGSHFDRLFFESEMHDRGIKIAKNALKKGILQKSEGAVVFRGDEYGLDTRVFINSLGIPTYEGKELALAELEFSEFGEIDKCIHVVGPEQASFFKVTFKVEELLNPKKYKDKQRHLAYGWVRLKHGKMSSRSGKVIEGEWLIDEAKKKIKDEYKTDEPAAERLAIAAIKYSFLKTSVTQETVFDFEESIALEGNSGPYLLYTYVRCHSILEKSSNSQFSILKTEYNTEELSLLRKIYQFPEVVEESAQALSPHLIATYLYNLAKDFNLFYQKQPVLKAEGTTREFRLALTMAVANILRWGLYLLGIQTVEEM